MSLGTSNRDAGKTSESGHLRAIYKSIVGEVLGGLNVTQRAAGANMSVDVQIGDAVLPRSDGTYGHPVFNDAVLNKTVTTSDPSNPRRDIVILYLDYGVTPSTAVSNNTNGVVAIKVVAGTAAGSPVDPNGAALQAAAGSGNPYVKLARIRVGAGVTTLSNSVIDDLRRAAVGLTNGGWIPALEDWAYASASTITVPTDATTKYDVGDYVKLVQGTTLKYFQITAVTSTLLTLTGLGGATVANSVIDIPYYSKNPQAHNLGLGVGPVWQYAGSAQYAGGTVTSVGATPTLVTNLTAPVNIPTNARALRATLQLQNIYLQTGDSQALTYLFTGASSGALTTQFAGGSANAGTGANNFGTNQTSLIGLITNPTSGQRYISAAIAASSSNARTDTSATAPATLILEVC